MTVLGEAVIEVRGDLRPFIRDLDSQLQRASDAFEQRMQASLRTGLSDATLGEDVGGRLGDGIGRGLRGRLGDPRRPPWINIAAALASALDDGISALPQEVKAAIVVGILLALPLISGALASAVSAGLGAGVAGLGLLLAYQYDPVEARFEDLGETLRIQLVTAASSFVPAAIRAADQVEARFKQMGPVINRIFTVGATFVEPLTRGLLNFLDQFLSGVDSAMGDVSGHVEEFARGLNTLGRAAGEVFRILADTGDDGRQAFRDLVLLIGATAVAAARLIGALTWVYGLVRDIVEALAIFSPLMAGLVQQSDAAAEAGRGLAGTNQILADSFSGPIKMTQEQERELDRLRRALEGASDATYGIIQSQIDFERSLDNIAEAVKENGRTFDITSEKGRRNVEEFLTGLKAAEEGTLSQVAMGKLSSQQAAEYYDLQIAKLKELARQSGLTGAEFDVLFGNIVTVAQLKLDAGAMGIVGTQEELSQAVREAAELYQQLQRIRDFRLPAQGTRRFSEYAEGGIVTHPTFGLLGEAGPEVVVPLTKPQRAAQLLQQSGLAGMLGGGGTVVNVYVGNEQLDARTYQIVEQNNAAMSNSLAFGARGL